MASKSVAIAIFRRDLRVADNPLLHSLVTQTDSVPDFLLPIYVFQANQFEVSGFIPDGSPSPYKPARSEVGGFYRCGKYRAEFIANAVVDLKQSLESLGSGLAIRVGLIPEVIQSLAKALPRSGYHVKSVWMTSHEGSEEKLDEKGVKFLCADLKAEFKLLNDEKYLIDDRDTGLSPDMSNLPDVFTTYRKNQEPLGEKPRPVLPAPSKGDLPPFPDASAIPAQHAPFVIPNTADGLIEAVVKPVRDFLPNMPPFPENTESAHPFKGGETYAHRRLNHLVRSRIFSLYDTTRNGLLGGDFSTKLSGYLAQGCLTARQVHHAMAALENGTDAAYEDVEGYGQGEIPGTKSVRFELLWRDYMRLCHKKYGNKLFHLRGLRSDYKDNTGKPRKTGWKSADKERASENQEPDYKTIGEYLERFKAGTTGLGFIDASQRELLHTGYTSNRARQNVASFLSKHLSIDWRYGAEWYEMLLVDYDVSSNWANWQYVSGVGNDPRGDLRIFNPIKQAFDYDKNGDYVRAWVPEVRGLQRLEEVFQACTASEEDRAAAGLADNIMATNPIHRINFDVAHRPRSSRYLQRGARFKAIRQVQINVAGDGDGNNNTNGTGSVHGDASIVNGSGTVPKTSAASGRGYQGSYVNQNGYGGQVNGGRYNHRGGGGANGTRGGNPFVRGRGGQQNGYSVAQPREQSSNNGVQNS
ncbi:putative cryptochrome DASH, mitochondrial [Podospora fimiseda]|uniref:Cryptochrome DASH n=1 Tax=Podospora fimiseda TaxID=252190 RepID=A0AAN7BV19_9PEZI|nr:putative cryptochrome DASH, mitochondrial [Podospora fimiseda]